LNHFINDRQERGYLFLAINNRIPSVMRRALTKKWVRSIKPLRRAVSAFNKRWLPIDVYQLCGKGKDKERRLISPAVQQLVLTTI